nr:FAD-dependent oxidoreductase [Klebsiella pneumoniae]
MTGRLDSEVIIIGGGATGAGIARDCARRGLRTLLIERHDIATGATGRNHGLLHSGARYAVTDNESARECISENRILRRIARHCIEPTNGLFITLPEDRSLYPSLFPSFSSFLFFFSPSFSSPSFPLLSPFLSL